jgi:histone arginine demethylase JMJD6
MLWGTRHSRSEVHVDPYNWTGSNALLFGKKTWKLYPPGQDHWLYPRANALCGSPLNCHKYQSRVDAFAYDGGDNIDPAFHTHLRRKFPEFARARAWSATQVPGELMVIPPGWFHQVQNEEESLAVASQAWTDDGFEATLEEIAKFPGNAPAFDYMEKSLSRQEKLSKLLAAIPAAVVDSARRQVADTHRRIQTSSKKTKMKKENKKKKEKKEKKKKKREEKKQRRK